MDKKIDYNSLTVRVDGGDSIGLLLVYSLPEKSFNIDKVRSSFEENDLLDKHLPSAIKPINAFKRVTTNVVKGATIKKIVDEIGAEDFKKFKFSVVDVDITGEQPYSYRNLVITKTKTTTEDTKFDSVEFEKEVVMFFHDNENEVMSAIPSEEYKNNEFIKILIEYAKEEYLREIEQFSIGQMRNILKKTLEEMRAVNLVSSHFIRNEFRDQAINFVKVVEEIGGNAMFFNVMDGASDKEQIKQKYLKYVDEMVEKVETGEFKNATKRDIEIMLNAIKEANEDYATFGELLSIDQTKLESGKERLFKVATALVDHVDELNEQIRINRQNGRKKVNNKA